MPLGRDLGHLRAVVAARLSPILLVVRVLCLAVRSKPRNPVAVRSLLDAPVGK